jgi:hypothetical protein
MLMDKGSQAIKQPWIKTRKAYDWVRRLAEPIRCAAGQYAVQPEIIAAILVDEIIRSDVVDELQVSWAKSYANSAPGNGHRRLKFWQWISPKPIEEQSFGLSQMTLKAYTSLQKAGYLPVKSAAETPLKTALADLVSSRNAPVLIAARLRQTIDLWGNEGVDISCQPEILGTLYSMGLTGFQGVHPEPRANPRGLQIAQSLPAIRALLEQ